MSQLLRGKKDGSKVFHTNNGADIFRLIHKKAIERVDQHNNSNFNFINNPKKNADLIKKIRAIKNINAIDSDLLNSYDYIRGFLIGHKDAFLKATHSEYSFPPEFAAFWNIPMKANAADAALAKSPSPVKRDYYSAAFAAAKNSAIKFAAARAKSPSYTRKRSPSPKRAKSPSPRGLVPPPINTSNTNLSRRKRIMNMGIHEAKMKRLLSGNPRSP